MSWSCFLQWHVLLIDVIKSALNLEIIWKVLYFNKYFSKLHYCFFFKIQHQTPLKLFFINNLLFYGQTLLSQNYEDSTGPSLKSISILQWLQGNGYSLSFNFTLPKDLKPFSRSGRMIFSKSYLTTFPFRLITRTLARWYCNSFLGFLFLN